MPIEPPRPNEGLVEAIRMIAGADDDYAFVALGTVDAFKQPGDDLAAVLRMLAAEPLTITDRVDLVDEQNGRRFLPGLGKGGAHRLEQIAEVPMCLPSGERAEHQMHAACGGEGSGEGRLASPRWAADQDPTIHV